MNLQNNWNKIRSHFQRSFKSSLSVSIASVDKNNKPNVTPIGTLFLNDDQTGFYFEKFPSKLPIDVMTNNQVCILGVNSSKKFWVKSLFKGKFSSYPAIKLYGTLGEKRKATLSENYALSRRMRNTKKLRGHKLLWSNMEYIREVSFTHAEMVKIGVMTQEL